MNKYQNKIKGAGLQCETIPSFNINFDQADLFMDMRSPECKAQFDIDDWIQPLYLQQVINHFSN